MNVIKEIIEGNSTSKRAYFGFEPSGRLHKGILNVVEGLKHAVTLGYEPVVLVADVHAQLNGKKIDLGAVETLRPYLPKGTEIIIQSQAIVDYDFSRKTEDSYLGVLSQFAQVVTITRALRAIDCAGREPNTAYCSALQYTLMQCVDMHMLNIGCAIGGTDQRKVHMLYREICDKLKLPKPMMIHTEILTDDKGVKIGKSTHGDKQEWWLT